jgi:hypothetical protein
MFSGLELYEPVSDPKLTLPLLLTNTLEYVLPKKSNEKPRSRAAKVASSFWEHPGSGAPMLVV